jgi:hypothetical protein
MVSSLMSPGPDALFAPTYLARESSEGSRRSVNEALIHSDCRRCIKVARRTVQTSAHHRPKAFRSKAPSPWFSSD